VRSQRHLRRCSLRRSSLASATARRLRGPSQTTEMKKGCQFASAGRLQSRVPRIAIVGLACSTFLILLSSSAVPQEARAGADAGLGQLIFNNACRTCHTTKEGDNRLGPNLHNIIGRKAGSLPTFGYSFAMKGADFVWDKEKLDGFIAKPDEVVPGNNMKPYGGLASADRTKLITFLQSPTLD
jgi:cytochrome c